MSAAGANAVASALASSSAADRALTPTPLPQAGEGLNRAVAPLPAPRRKSPRMASGRRTESALPRTDLSRPSFHHQIRTR
ncbi:hypothetical protein [Lysobacter gummosus]|uniref:hypothetical protein n=1 Tax=Lysobacter gummosus TaxID=262324 RepID=UPI0036409C9E